MMVGRGAARLVVAALGIAALTVIGLTPASADLPTIPRVIVLITAHGPNPRIARALTGQEVVFRNSDVRQRRIVSLQNLFESPALAGAEGSSRHGIAGRGEVSVIFEDPGLYPYAASGRPRQTGTILVKDPPDVQRAPTPTPTPRRRSIRPPGTSRG
jgi:hypothetical protein